jgi:hypothetical protein
MTDIFKDSGDFDCNRPGPSGITQMHMENGQQPLSSSPKGTVSLWSDGHVKLIKPYDYPTKPGC